MFTEFSRKSRSTLRDRLSFGFTLIELLVVVAIVGILAAILLPVYNSVTRSAQSVKCLSNLRQVAVALSLYSSDHDNTFMLVGASDTNYAQTLAAYVPIGDARTRNNIFVSPAAAKPVTPYGNQTCITYALNQALFGGGTGVIPLKTNSVASPTKLIMVANAAQIPAYNYNCAYTFWNPWQLARGSGKYVTDMNAPIPVNDANNVDDYPGQGYLRYVQKGNTAINVAMVDGHAESIAKGNVLYCNVVYSK